MEPQVQLPVVPGDRLAISFREQSMAQSSESHAVKEAGGPGDAVQKPRMQGKACTALCLMVAFWGGPYLSRLLGSSSHLGGSQAHLPGVGAPIV